MLTDRIGPVSQNVFSTFGTTEFLLSQSIVPIVAWTEGSDEIRCIGTGFFISASGLLLTAGHVVRDPVDELYGLDKKTGKFSEQLKFGVLIAINPAAKNAPFDVPQDLRNSEYAICMFEWIVHWGRKIESPLFHEQDRFQLDLDVAVCKVRQNSIVGPFQPLAIGNQRLNPGDRAIAIGYAEMGNIRLGTGDKYRPELMVSVGSVITIHRDNLTHKSNSTPGPNFEFNAKIPGKMSGAPIFVGSGILAKGVASRSYQGESEATGCLIGPVMDLPLFGKQSLNDLQSEGHHGIPKVSGPDL